MNKSEKRHDSPENWKEQIMLRRIKDDLSNWRDLPDSWVYINISVLPKLI